MNFMVKKSKKWSPPFTLNKNYIQSCSFSGLNSQLHAVKPIWMILAFLQYTGGNDRSFKGAMLVITIWFITWSKSKHGIKAVSKKAKKLSSSFARSYHIFALNANCLLFAQYGAKNILITNPRDMAGFVKN